MDIFNRKKVAALESQIHDLEMIKLENDRLRTALDEVCDKLKETVKLVDTTPEDCTPGAYCRACEFGEQYYNVVYVSGAKSDRCYQNNILGITCRRGNACKNFIQKGEL